MKCRFDPRAAKAYENLPPSAVSAIIASVVMIFTACFADAATQVSDGFYKVQCGDSVADGGQLNAKGVVEVKSGHAAGVLRLELNVSSQEVDAPEAEQHVLPSLNVQGLISLGDSTFTTIDGRPQRLVLDLNATNWSMKNRLANFSLVDNNAPDDGDDETSSLVFDQQTYTGVCKIERK